MIVACHFLYPVVYLLIYQCYILTAVSPKRQAQLTVEKERKAVVVIRKFNRGLLYL